MGVSSFFYQCDDEITTSVTANCTHNSVRSGSMATQGPINSRLTSLVGTSLHFSTALTKTWAEVTPITAICFSQWYMEAVAHIVFRRKTTRLDQTCSDKT